jgi:predicted transcriptional regulator
VIFLADQTYFEKLQGIAKELDTTYSEILRQNLREYIRKYERKKVQNEN